MSPFIPFFNVFSTFQWLKFVFLSHRGRFCELLCVTVLPCFVHTAFQREVRGQRFDSFWIMFLYYCLFTLSFPCVCIVWHFHPAALTLTFTHFHAKIMLKVLGGFFVHNNLLSWFSFTYFYDMPHFLLCWSHSERRETEAFCSKILNWFNSIWRQMKWAESNKQRQ